MCEKTCNDGGYCQYRYQEGSLWGCKFIDYCDFQRPRDSRKIEPIQETKEQLTCTLCREIMWLGKGCPKCGSRHNAS